MYELLQTKEFEDWLDKQPTKHRLQIRARLLKIAQHSYFGDTKLLDVKTNLWELKWAIGWRVYYTYIEATKILLLLGGNKNGQNKDINEAKKILKNYTETSSQKGSKSF